MILEYPDEPSTPGEAAYNAWREAFRPRFTSWSKIGPQARRRWEAAAQAAIGFAENIVPPRDGRRET